MDNKNILIIGEASEGRLSAITHELLGIGRKLADLLAEELHILLIGSDIGSLGPEAIAFGADKVYIADDPLLKSFNSDANTFVAAKLYQQVLPSIILLGQTDIGRDLAPRLAGRLKAGLAMDCVALTIDPQTGLLVRTRPVYGGNAYATVISRNARPQMATTRAGAMAPAERNDSRKGEILKLDSPLDPTAVRLKVVEQVKEAVEGVRLEDAAVVVSGGRGMGGAENFKRIGELAKLLGGAVGATRAACDEGWIPATHQVGQTGKIVNPKLYIAIALSGSMQHLAGCSGSKCIVSINKDAEANIFRVARFGVVGDWKEALPALTEKLKELLS